MAGMFDVRELVKVAVSDEKTGVVFYTEAAAKTKDAKLRGTFEKLAEEERGHEKHFRGMLEQMGDVKPPEQYSGEYTAYLESLTSDRAFPDDAAAVEAVKRCSSDLEVLDLALSIERDTLILMEEMQKLVAERDRRIVETLADEERSHIVALTKARKGVAG
ncbi:MAG TPA: ferritin family protein [Planctomycetota bacterium]|nr:ferritin family protein [Planctomycetota bacterium]